MPYRRLNRRARAAVIWFLACSAVFSQVPAALNNESGTLALAARTSLEVTIAVDSRITGIDPSGTIPTPPIDGSRKLVDIGTTGACALVGFLGTNSQNGDVAGALRNWAREHPGVGPREGIDGLLQAAAEIWNGNLAEPIEKGERLPLGREPGDLITTLLCGDFANGRPSIIRGRTYVAPDRKASWKILEPIGGDVFLVSGVFGDDALFVEILVNPQAATNLDALPGELAVGDVIRAKKLAMDPINRWIAYAKQVGPHATTAPQSQKPVQTFPPTSKDNSPKTDQVSVSPWSLSDAKDVFGVLFASVESQFPNEVSPPNNLRASCKIPALSAFKRGDSEH